MVKKKVRHIKTAKGSVRDVIFAIAASIEESSSPDDLWFKGWVAGAGRVIGELDARGIDIDS